MVLLVLFIVFMVLALAERFPGWPASFPGGIFLYAAVVCLGLRVFGSHL